MIEFLMVLGAPLPVAPYSHATAVDGWVFVTGQLPLDAGRQFAFAARNRGAKPQRYRESPDSSGGVGSGFHLVVFARIYLTQFERDYAAMNAVYQSYFVPNRLPARTCIGVTALACGALVEIDLLARKADERST